MNIVSPIRSMDTVREVKRQAQLMGRQQYLMVLLGLNTGLRISDILQITVGDIQERGYIVRREIKTGKQTEIRFHPAVVSEIKRLTADRPMDELLFMSRQIGRSRKSVSRGTAYKWIVSACRRAGMTEPVGCHTLRKTYGYHHYMQNRDVVLLMMHFNHSSEAVTLRYIGVTQDQINRTTQKFRL